MSVAFSRSDPPLAEKSRPFPVHGAARISFVLRGKESRLEGLYQRDPVRVLFPNTKADEPPQAVIVTTSGGLVGGDVIDIEARVGRDAAALFTVQAAEKIYRSSGEDCIFRIKLTVEPGGWLEWLPQETILFNGARMRRLTQVNLAPKAQILAGEFLVFGRKARGEKMTKGLVRDAWEIRRDGRMVWADALHMDGDIASQLDHPACFDGAGALATAVYGGDDLPGALDLARDLTGENREDVLAGATVVGDMLIVRWIGKDAYVLRKSFGDFWARFRHAVAGLAPELPRLWYV